MYLFTVDNLRYTSLFFNVNFEAFVFVCDILNKKLLIIPRNNIVIKWNFIVATDEI